MPTQSPSGPARRGFLAAGAGALLAAACSRSEGSGSGTAASVDPKSASGWGPTQGELQQAAELVGGWSPEQLAGQVMVGRYRGTQPKVAHDMVRSLHLAGVCVTLSNIDSAAQLRATTAAVRKAVTETGRDFPAVIGVDQEGGTVSHLQNIATKFPAFEQAGKAIKADGAKGEAVVQEAAAAMGQETASYGFSWIFAPVADVTVGSADPTIGSRSASKDPQIAARATVAAVKGFTSVGIVSSVKHFPGHGSLTQNSHKKLPVQRRSLAQLRASDLVPFQAAVRAGVPAVMLGHINTLAIAPGGPASVMPKAYEFLRRDLGFNGVAITDSLGMGGVLGKGDPGVRALIAGADLILMPVNSAATHRAILAAVKDGSLGQDRLKDAAARVVALQRWQARSVKTGTAASIRARAHRAASALAAAK